MFFISGVLVPFFTLWGKISFFQIMIVQAFFMFMIVILEIPSGAVADYLGRKTTLMIASICGIIAVLIYGSYPVITIFLIGELFFAISGALISGASEALVYDTLKKNKKRKYFQKNFW